MTTTALICGSLAYDSIMVFEDHFKNHILPDKVHMLNVSFLVPHFNRDFGGCAGNIGYNLKLLGDEPLIAAAVLTVLLSTAALPAENMLLARFTPARHRSLAFGVKFVLAFATAPLAIAFVSFVQARSGEFVWLFAALAGIAAVAATAALMLPGEHRRRAVPLAAE